MNCELQAARTVRGLFKQPGEDGYNADEAKPWKEVSGRTRAALILTQGTMAGQRAQTMSQAPVQLGVIFMEKRLADTPQNRIDWEAEARALNDARAIEAVAVPKKEGTGG